MLNNIQKKVALDLTGNTIVSASPGTGKTKTLVARAEKKLESIPKHKSLALITYTNAGADEISDRISNNDKNVFIGTIHRFCLEFILRPFGWIYKWKNPKIITYAELKEFVENNNTIDLGDNPLSELSKIKRLLNGGLDLSTNWENVTTLEETAKLYYDFLESKSSIDFNEILYRSYKILSENNFVSKSLASKFYEISVDEFQDTNIYQYEILKAIHKEKSCTFFMVGDEKQRIYSFAGAIEKAFEMASKDFDATVETLDITYRSSQGIVNGYSSLFDNHPSLINQSQKNPNHTTIYIQEVDNKRNTPVIENTTFIKDCIKKLADKKIPLSNIAILTANWWDAFSIGGKLRQDYPIVGLGALPHNSTKSSTFTLVCCISKFLHSPTVSHLKKIRRNIELHILENGLDLTEKELTHCLNFLITNIKKVDSKCNLIQGLQSLKTIFDKIFSINHSSFDEIISGIKGDEGNNWTLDKYFQVLSGIDGITINTIHQSKGLEYEVVFLSGVNENKIPYQRLLDKSSWTYEELTQENLDNGRTQLYVGMSRAKSILIVTHNWKPSMFISTIKKS